MPNFLEQLVAEWYEFRGYFVRRNVHVGKLSKGGYECELDIIAFNPINRHLVHIEPSMDSDSWDKRERRFTRKFSAGKKYIPEIFSGFGDLPEIYPIAVFVFASDKSRTSVGGGKILHIKELMNEIKNTVNKKKIQNAAIPEQFVILRSLQFAANFWTHDDQYDN
ncbi:hypothetical protein [Acidiphilium iwatense]|nr:hypothetical protein [Acidiphilium iwatense]